MLSSVHSPGHTMWCYRKNALHAAMSLISFVFSLLFSPYKRNTGPFNLLTFSFHNSLTFLFKGQYYVTQSAHYINTAFFSIQSRPYSPNRVTRCISRHHSELLRLVQEFRMFKTDNSHGKNTLLLKSVSVPLFLSAFDWDIVDHKISNYKVWMTNIICC